MITDILCNKIDSGKVESRPESPDDARSALRESIFSNLPTMAAAAAMAARSSGVLSG